MRSIVHTCKKIVAFINDDGTVTPCKNGCEERSYFNVWLFGKPVRNADRVVFNKSGLVVLFDFTIKEIFKVVFGILLHRVKLGWKRLKELQHMHEELCHECTNKIATNARMKDHSH